MGSLVHISKFGGKPNIFRAIAKPFPALYSGALFDFCLALVGKGGESDVGKSTNFSCIAYLTGTVKQEPIQGY